MGWGIFPAWVGAVGSYLEARRRAEEVERAYLETLSPEDRAIFLAREEERRRQRQAEQDQMTLLGRSREIRLWIEGGRRLAEERLDGDPEVILARDLIASNILRGSAAEQLLAFARTLAQKRSGGRPAAGESNNAPATKAGAQSEGVRR